MFFWFFPLLFLIAGIGAGFLVSRQKGGRKHKHKCPKCDFIWEHTTRQGQRARAHNCPRCGTEQRWKYFED